MKGLRILLVAVLVLMLPLRGVMAASMLCAPPAAAAADAHAMHDAHALHAAHAAHGEAAAPHGEAGGHVHPAPAAKAGCNLCSACCSVPPLPSAAPAVAPPHAVTARPFPALSVPAPSFVSGGPERPPRSI